MNELMTISKLQQAQLAIHEVKELDEIKRLVDQSEALKGYAKAQQLSKDMQNDIAEYNLYATRQMGIISAELEKAKANQHTNVLCPHNGHSKTEALAEAGIEREQREQRREEERTTNTEKIEKLDNPLEAMGLFQTIVIDPPWPMK